MWQTTCSLPFFLLDISSRPSYLRQLYFCSAQWKRCSLKWDFVQIVATLSSPHWHFAFSNLMGRQGQMYWIAASEFEPIVEQTAWCWQGCPAKEAVDKLAVDDKYFLQPAPVSDSYKWSVVSTLFVFYVPFPTIIPSLISSCLSIEAVRSYWKKCAFTFLYQDGVLQIWGLLAFCGARPIPVTRVSYNRRGGWVDLILTKIRRPLPVHSRTTAMYLPRFD